MRNYILSNNLSFFRQCNQEVLASERNFKEIEQFLSLDIDDRFHLVILYYGLLALTHCLLFSTLVEGRDTI